MKKGILLLILISALCLVTKAQQIVSWVGKYHYDEEPVKALAGYSMVMTWDLSINNKDEGVLEVNGQQTYIKAAIRVEGSKDSVSIIFDKMLDGVSESYKKGTVFFTLKRKGKLLTTYWAAIGERLPEKSPKSCKCFIVEK